MSAPFAVADQQEFDLRISADQFRRDGEQIVVPLELEQPRDFADDEIVRRDSQFRAQTPGHFSPQETVRAQSR